MKSVLIIISLIVLVTGLNVGHKKVPIQLTKREPRLIDAQGLVPANQTEKFTDYCQEKYIDKFPSWMAPNDTSSVCEKLRNTGSWKGSCDGEYCWSRCEDEGFLQPWCWVGNPNTKKYFTCNSDSDCPGKQLNLDKGLGWPFSGTVNLCISPCSSL